MTAKAKEATGSEKAAQKKPKPTLARKSTSASKSAAGQIDISAVKSDGPECDHAKGAALSIDTVVQGLWGDSEWSFAAVGSIVWDEDPPWFGDEQWAYTLKWDDGDD